MSAQPLEGRGPADRPWTIGQVRRALPHDLRDRFQDDVDAAEPQDLFALVARWAAVAQTAEDQDVAAAVAAVRAGHADTYEIGEVFPALEGML